MNAERYGNALTLVGNNGSNVLRATAFHDVIQGGRGNDHLYGLAGNDRLDGGEGADVLVGGAGNDTYVVSDSSDTLTELANEGTDSVISRVSFTLSDHLDNLVLTGSYAIDGIGNDLANVLTGNSNANKLSGGAGDDLLDGGGGHDRLYGGYGRDTLNDGSGSDTLFGGKDADTLVDGEGSDWIEGGAGADSSSGGSGADRFVFRQGDFSGAASAEFERITDFNGGEGDLIDLSFLDADRGLDGDQAFTFIGSLAFSGMAGQLRFQQVDGNTYLQFDTDGDGTANFALRLDGLLSLGSKDFIL